MESLTSSRSSSLDPVSGDVSGHKPDVQAVLETLSAERKQALLRALLTEDITLSDDSTTLSEEDSRTMRSRLFQERRSTGFFGSAFMGRDSHAAFARPRASAAAFRPLGQGGASAHARFRLEFPNSGTKARVKPSKVGKDEARLLSFPDSPNPATLRAMLDQFQFCISVYGWDKSDVLAAMMSLWSPVLQRQTLLRNFIVRTDLDGLLQYLASQYASPTEVTKYAAATRAMSQARDETLCDFAQRAAEAFQPLIDAGAATEIDVVATVLANAHPDMRNGPSSAFMHMLDSSVSDLCTLGRETSPLGVFLATLADLSEQLPSPNTMAPHMATRDVHSEPASESQDDPSQEEPTSASDSDDNY